MFTGKQKSIARTSEFTGAHVASRCLEISQSSCATSTLHWHFLLFLSFRKNILHFSTWKEYQKIVTHYWFLNNSNSIEGAEFFYKNHFIIVFCHWKIFPETEIRAIKTWGWFSILTIEYSLLCQRKSAI